MQLRENVSLRPFNTFHIDVSARFFCRIESATDLKKTLKDHSFISIPKLILGGGSNILFTKNIDALVIHNCIKGIEIIKKDEEYILIRSGAGEVWNDLVKFCVERNYGGIENLSLIPGSVGAAPMQNIGAYGVELKESFVELSALNVETAEEKIFSKEECKFGYRESIFKNEVKGKYIIASVTLRLNKKPLLNTSYGAIEQELKRTNQLPSVQSISEAVCNIRRSKLPDPDVIGNAGSFFKNPVVSKQKFEELIAEFPSMPHYPANAHSAESMHKLAAGWMIEQCGWKGKQVGNAASHKDQALVLVNCGNATGAEIISLAEKIQQSVREKFGVEIIPEVNIY